MLGIVVGLLMVILGIVLKDWWVIGAGVGCAVVGILLEVSNS